MAAVLIAIGTMLCLTATPAHAHANLERSEPVDDAELTEGPQQVRLWYSESISISFSSFEVRSTGGRLVPIEVVATEDSTSFVELALPELSDGVYTVRWQVLSEDDGHTAGGLIAFGVNAAVPASAATGPDSSVSAFDVVIKWLDLCFLATLIGALAMGRLVLGSSDGARGRDRTRALARRRVFGLAALMGPAALAAGVAQVIAHIEAVRPPGASWFGAGGQLLGQTQWGNLWLFRQALVLALAAVAVRLWRLEREPRGAPAVLPPTVGALAIGLAIVNASSGHSGALAEGRGLAVAADALHLLAAAAWVGGLVALVVGLAPLLRAPPGELAREARSYLRSFGKWAALSVGVLVATGIYSAGRHVASPDALILTPYGKALLGKTALIAAAGALGLINSAILHPRLSRSIGRVLRRAPGWTLLPAGRLRVVLMTEATVGVLILLMVGVMGSTAPARGPEFAPGVGDSGNLLTRESGDVLVTLHIKPNRPGQNAFMVAAANMRRPSPGEIDGVTLRFSRPGDDATETVSAQRIGPGEFRADGDQLDQATEWRIAVSVGRAGAPDKVVPFAWTVPPPAGRHDVILSDQPLGPVTTPAALIVGSLVLVAAGLVWPRSARRQTIRPSVALSRISREV